ncbi:hypothetical protein [Lysobacter gummosus]|uniref:hypothetical protein n=1 Tax=Lysobacter gummosus TaxID=262324 RepID=UPI00363ED0DC
MGATRSTERSARCGRPASAAAAATNRFVIDRTRRRQTMARLLLHALSQTLWFDGENAT